MPWPYSRRRGTVLRSCARSSMRAHPRVRAFSARPELPFGFSRERAIARRAAMTRWLVDKRSRRNPRVGDTDRVPNWKTLGCVIREKCSVGGTCAVLAFRAPLARINGHVSRISTGTEKSAWFSFFRINEVLFILSVLLLSTPPCLCTFGKLKLLFFLQVYYRVFYRQDIRIHIRCFFVGCIL